MGSSFPLSRIKYYVKAARGALVSVQGKNIMPVSAKVDDARHRNLCSGMSDAACFLKPPEADIDADLYLNKRAHECTAWGSTDLN